MNKALSATDPLGHRVMLPQDLCAPTGKPVQDTLIAAIRKPALLIRIDTEEEGTELHYYHSVDWDLQLLISVRKAGSHWKAFACRANPASSVLAQLLERGSRLI